ncbi:hypothetical protein, partial [Chitinimonas sp.]|uniref:hypothetical protein n=1 Tax=Chitinimonas sp. TaxID=1934313 RepID=UPI0035B3BF20
MPPTTSAVRALKQTSGASHINGAPIDRQFFGNNIAQAHIAFHPVFAVAGQLEIARLGVGKQIATGIGQQAKYNQTIAIEPVTDRHPGGSSIAGSEYA